MACRLIDAKPSFWFIVNRVLGNTMQWHLNRILNVLMPESVFEFVVCEMASILFRPQYVNSATLAIRLFRQIAKNTFNTVMSSWARWGLKSIAYPLFAQLLVQAQIKENIKAPRHWPLWGEFTANRRNPHTRPVAWKNVSILRRHYENSAFLSLLNGNSPVLSGLHSHTASYPGKLFHIIASRHHAI